MRRLGASLGALALFALPWGAANPALAQVCPTGQNSTPGFPDGGSAFGRLASQWNAYFGAKVDANNGVLCNPKIVGPSIIVNGGPLVFGPTTSTPGEIALWNSSTGNLLKDGAGVSISHIGNFGVTGNFSVTGPSSLTGALGVTGAVTVTGSTTLTGAVGITGTVSLTGGLAVLGGSGAVDLTASTAALSLLDKPGSTTSPAQPYNSNVASQRLEFAYGSLASPVVTGGPMFRLTLVNEYNSAALAGCGAGIPTAGACTSAMVVSNIGLAGSVMMTNGATFVGANSGTGGLNTSDAVGLQAIGIIQNSGTGIGTGLFAQGQRNNSTAYALGAEVTTYDGGGVDCNTPNFTTVSQCDGLWVTSRSNGPGVYTLSAALHVGLGDAVMHSRWGSGIVFNNNSVLNVVFDDQTSASTVFNLAGAHANALTSAAQAGLWGFGTTTPGARVEIGGNLTAAFWGANGALLRVGSATPVVLTDSTSSGATAEEDANTIFPVTLAALNPITVASSATLHIAGPTLTSGGVSITQPLSLHVSGPSLFSSTAQPAVYAQSTGSNDAFVVVDTVVGGRQSLVSFRDAATDLWQVGKDGSGNFIVKNVAASMVALSVTGAGLLSLGETAGITVNASGLVNLPVIAGGTPAASACIDASGNLIKKVTSGACI